MLPEHNYHDPSLLAMLVRTDESGKTKTSGGAQLPTHDLGKIVRGL